MDCEVFSGVNIFAFLKFHAFLADDDVSSSHDFTSEFFDSEVLRFAVANIMGATTRFLMSHLEKLGDALWAGL